MSHEDDEAFRWLRCAQCGRAFEKAGDNWYRLSRMHQDRIGSGPFDLCSQHCGIAFLLGQSEITVNLEIR